MWADPETKGLLYSANVNSRIEPREAKPAMQTKIKLKGSIHLRPEIQIKPKCIFPC